MIADELEQVKSQIINQFLPPATIVKIIEKVIGEKYGLIFTSYAREYEDETLAVINGYFDPTEPNEPPNIELVFVHHPNFTEGIEFDEDSWDGFSFRVDQVLQHEFIHKEQYKNRGEILLINPHYTDSIEYLEDPDEIEAHAHDIMLELLKYGHSFDEAIIRLQDFKSITSKESLNLFSYLVHFSYNIKHSVFSPLIKRTIKYLEEKRDGKD